MIASSLSMAEVHLILGELDSLAVLVLFGEFLMVFGGFFGGFWVFLVHFAGFC